MSLSWRSEPTSAYARWTAKGDTFEATVEYQGKQFWPAVRPTGGTSPQRWTVPAEGLSTLEAAQKWILGQLAHL